MGEQKVPRFDSYTFEGKWRVWLPRCEALGVDVWICSPHFIKRCQLRAHHRRRGLAVCRVHKVAPVLYRWNGEIPDWPDMAAEARRKARRRL